MADVNELMEATVQAVPRILSGTPDEAREAMKFVRMVDDFPSYCSVAHALATAAAHFAGPNLERNAFGQATFAMAYPLPEDDATLAAARVMVSIINNDLEMADAVVYAMHDHSADRAGMFLAKLAMLARQMWEMNRDLAALNSAEDTQ